MEEPQSLLHEALREQEARLGQLLDVKLEDHRARVAEVLVQHLAEQRCPRADSRGSAPGRAAAITCTTRPGAPQCQATLATEAEPGSLAGEAGQAPSPAGSFLHGEVQRAAKPTAPARHPALLKGSGNSRPTQLARASTGSNFWTNIVAEGCLMDQCRENLKSEASRMDLRSANRNTIGSRGSVVSWVYRIYSTQWFEVCLAILIVLNSVCIGLFAEWSLKHAGEPRPLWYEVANAFFLAAFTLELIIRIISEGRRFANSRNVHFRWNVFDSMLVALTMVEELLRLTVVVPSFEVSFVRLARLLRLVRVLRLIRLLRFFKELREMTLGILHCSKPLAWAALLLTILSYMFVVFLLQVAGAWAEEHFSDPAEGRQAIDSIMGDFTSLPWGVYTLFKCISNGKEWGRVADELTVISPILVSVFCFYIVVGIFCVCNVITSVFIEASRSRRNDEAQVLEHLQTKQDWMREAKAFLQSFVEEEDLGILDESGEVKISWAEFEVLVQMPRTKAFFEEQGLDLYFEKPSAIFQLIDLDQNGTIDLNEFIVGLHRLKGGARGLHLHLEMRQTMRKMERMQALNAEIYTILKATFGGQLSSAVAGGGGVAAASGPQLAKAESSQTLRSVATEVSGFSTQRPPPHVNAVEHGLKSAKPGAIGTSSSLTAEGPETSTRRPSPDSGSSNAAAAAVCADGWKFGQGRGPKPPVRIRL